MTNEEIIAEARAVCRGAITEIEGLRAENRSLREEVLRLRLLVSVAVPVMQAQDIFSKPLRKLEVVKK